MLLARLIADRPDELRADLMETYGVCLDAAMDGGYPAPFVAALAEQLPQSCRWRVSYDKDAWWDGDRMLAANIANSLSLYIWAMSDRKRRGKKPTMLGPSWAVENKTHRTLAAVPMDKAALLAELAKPRTAKAG